MTGRGFGCGCDLIREALAAKNLGGESRAEPKAVGKGQREIRAVYGAAAVFELGQLFAQLFGELVLKTLLFKRRGKALDA